MARVAKLVALFLLAGCEVIGVRSLDNIAASFDGSGYPVTVCDARYSGAAAQCSIRDQGQALRLKGIVIANERILLGGEIRVGQDGRITDVGCTVPRQNTVIIDCPGAVISPGFINLHEHIEYSYQQPPLPLPRKWDHRNEWRDRKDERGFDYPLPPDNEKSAVAERAILRHMLGGTTAMAGVKKYQAFARNLTLAAGTLGNPGPKAIKDDTFPITSDAKEILTQPCTEDQINVVRKKIQQGKFYVPHVGEGVNAGARFEIDCVATALQLQSQTGSFIHGVGTNAAQAANLQARQISVILSPKSNFILYGATTQVPQLMASGVNLAIGTDWAPSGSLTMLDEMRCLASYSERNLAGYVTWADIHRMATSNAAKAASLGNELGSATAGQLADLVVIDTGGERSLGAALKAAAYSQILAVFVAGEGATFPTVWEKSLPKKLPNCSKDPRNLCGIERTICGASTANSLGVLLASKTYQINDAALCRPEAVAACIPVRAGKFDGVPKANDRDGDGIEDANDNCPGIFNPPLPYDNNQQAIFVGLDKACK